MTHHKKIQDFMVDEKIPQQYRDRIPLLVNEKDEILWVVGWRTSETAKLNHHQEGLKLIFNYFQFNKIMNIVESNFKNKLTNNEFVITMEVSPPDEFDLQSFFPKFDFYQKQQLML